MPSSATVKRRAGVVRQLSLQNSSPTTNKRGLTRQFSEEHVQVTGHGWNFDKPDLSLRIGAEDGPSTPTRHQTRPKPVKLAWGDRRQDSTESIPGDGVEVIARRCTGLPRPTSRMPRAPNFGLPNDKESLVLTRQQLAERLRRAWRDRDKKSNLDIFLAHSRPESAISARSAISDADSGTTKSHSGPVRATHRPEILQNSKSPQSTSNLTRNEELIERGKIKIDVTGCMQTDENCSNISIKNPALMDLLDFKMFPVADAAKKFGSDYGSKQFQLKNMSLSKRYSLDSADSSANKENIENSPSSPAPEKKECTTVTLTASDRRASFKSSQLLNKTITDSFALDDPCCGENSQVKTLKRPPLVRTSSAPVQRSSRPPSPNVQKNIKVPKPDPRVRTPEKKMVSPMDVNVTIENDENRPRSTTSQRKTKLNATRKKPKERDSDSSGEDEDKVEIHQRKGSRRRAVSRQTGGDIVTMVSLVSPSESDVEEQVASANVPSWVDYKEKQDVIECDESRGSIPRELQTNFILQKCVSLRKTTKTVSFSVHPNISRSCSASFPVRRAPPRSSIMVPTPLITPPTPVIHHEENKQIQDNRGVKRRLVRRRTVTAKEDEDNNSSDDTSKTDTSTEPVTEIIQPPNDDQNDCAQPAENEPELKTAKEKECWALYKRMVEKGVNVSYETVLRGMLTPTEYRLRKNQLLSRC